MHMIMPTRIGRVYNTSAQCQAVWSDAGMFLGKVTALAVVMPGESRTIEIPSFFRGHKGPGDHPVAHASLVALGSGVPGFDTSGYGYPNREFEYVNPPTGRYTTCWVRGYNWGEGESYMYYSHASSYSDTEIRFSASFVCATGYWKGTKPYHRYVSSATATLYIKYTNRFHTKVSKITGTYGNWEWSKRWAARILSLADDPPWRWTTRGFEEPTIRPYLHDIADDVREYAAVYVSSLRVHGTTPIGSGSERQVVLEDFLPRLPSLGRHSFIFNELMTKYYGDSPLLVRRSRGDNAGFFLKEAEERAYVDAIQRVPRLNENSLQNIGEIAKFIYSLVVLHRIEIPRSLSDAWLRYRYQYTTTKLDAREAIEFVHRRMDLPEGSDFSVYGYGNCTYHGVTGTVECGFRVSPKEVSTLGRVWKALYTYGLEPNFYVIWDSIPFSFIVDWLIPIGSVASVADAQRNIQTHYSISHVNWSLKYQYVGEDGHLYKCYTRWQGSVPSSLTGLYLFDSDRKSKRVWGYRLLDAVSLILG